MIGIKEYFEEEKQQKVIKETDKYKVVKCEYNARGNNDNCPLMGVYMAVGLDCIKGAVPIGINTSSCIYSQSSAIVAQTLCTWPPLICDVDPDDVVFGVEDKAVDAVKGVEEVFDCDLVFVASGCSADIIGTDMEGVVAKVKKSMKRAEVVWAETGGFKGNSIDGYDMVLKALIEQLMEEPMLKWENTVNLLGVFPIFDRFWEGNMNEMKRLMGRCGIKVHSVLTGDCDLKRIKEATQVSLNVVLSNIMGIKAAKAMEEKFGLPYISAERNIPIGFEGTRLFVSEVCDALNIRGYEDILDEEEERTKKRIVRYTDTISDILLQSGQFGIRANSDIARGLIGFLGKEMGWVPLVVGLNGYNDSGIEQIEKAMEEILDPFLYPQAKILLDPDDRTIKAVMTEYRPAWIFGTTTERDLTELLEGETRIIEITYPSVRRYSLYPRALMGYEGAIMLIDEILNNLQP